VNDPRRDDPDDELVQYAMGIVFLALVLIAMIAMVEVELARLVNRV
jgi:hypothetical protein